MSCCLLGGSKPHQLVQNMDAIATAIKLDADKLEKIEKILDNKPKTGASAWQSMKQKYITNPVVR